MIPLLDIARELLGHPRRERYHLVRPTFRLIADADYWMRRQEADGAAVWPTARWGAEQRKIVILDWYAIRWRHHVAWLERGGRGSE